METFQMQQRRDRILGTTEGRIVGFKPNTRGEFIQAPFISLEQACTGLDPGVPFHIELSPYLQLLLMVTRFNLIDSSEYPTLDETVDWQTSPHWLSLHSYLDAILATLTTLPSRFSAREILLSSFSPDICIVLALKKVPYPVYFLNDARAPRPDSRTVSLQSALHFASAWGLDGIILESTPLAACPRLAHLAKVRGLGLATYGAKNNDPECVRLQRESGVQGIVVDRVKEIIMACEA